MSILHLTRRAPKSPGEHPYPDLPDPDASVTEAIASLPAEADVAPARALWPSFTPAPPAPTGPMPALAGTPGAWSTDEGTVRNLLDADQRGPGRAPWTEAEPERPVPFGTDAKALVIFRATLRRNGWCGLHARSEAPAPLPLLRRNPSLDRWQARADNAAMTAVQATRAEMRHRKEMFDAREQFLRQRRVMTGNAA
jgi:hypothetical protein